MFGNIFLFLTALFLLGLYVLNISKPPKGADAMGYAILLIILGAGFIFCHLIFTIVLLNKNGFDWVSDSSGTRIVAGLFFWGVVCLTTFMCTSFKWEWYEGDGFPILLRWLAVKEGQLWIPLLALIPYYMLLNANTPASVPFQAIKIPLLLSIAICTIYSGSLLVGYFKVSLGESNNIMQYKDEWHQKVLDEIAAHQPTDPIVSLLAQSWIARPEDTRALALKKIYEHPNWEAETLVVLKDKNTYQEAYYFLDGNKVTHPALFAEPLNQSILWLAEHVKQDIQYSNNLQDWSFADIGIDRCLNAIDQQFHNQGIDFYPNVLKLKQALETPKPERFENIEFNVTSMVNNWLEKHKK